MEIEKISENQICCTLTKEDLAERQIKISELAYGTEKVKALFSDVMQQASYEFGFEAEDFPLMIEAIPSTAGSITLIITKVEYPEELDTRFSKFSEANPEDLADSAYEDKEAIMAEGADNILGLFKRIQEQYKKQKEDIVTPLEETLKKKKVPEVIVDISKIFVFSDLEQIIRLSYVLKGFYNEKNVLYKNEAIHKYYLVVTKGSQSPEDFNKVCNILAEYALQQTHTIAAEAFLKEHYQVILSENALQVLAEL